MYDVFTLPGNRWTSSFETQTTSTRVETQDNYQHNHSYKNESAFPSKGKVKLTNSFDKARFRFNARQ